MRGDDETGSRTTQNGRLVVLDPSVTAVQGLNKIYFAHCEYIVAVCNDQASLKLFFQISGEEWSAASCPCWGIANVKCSNLFRDLVEQNTVCKKQHKFYVHSFAVLNENRSHDSVNQLRE